MKKRKVLKFAFMLLVFTGILLFLQMIHFGSLTGSVIIEDLDRDDPIAANFENITITSLSISEEQENPSFVATLVVVLALIIVFFVVKYLTGHHKNVMHGSSGKKGRKLIKLDLSARRK